MIARVCTEVSSRMTDDIKQRFGFAVSVISVKDKQSNDVSEQIKITITRTALDAEMLSELPDRVLPYEPECVREELFDFDEDVLQEPAREEVRKFLFYAFYCTSPTVLVERDQSVKLFIIKDTELEKYLINLPITRKDYYGNTWEKEFQPAVWQSGWELAHVFDRDQAEAVLDFLRERYSAAGLVLQELLISETVTYEYKWELRPIAAIVAKWYQSDVSDSVITRKLL
jgi:hypothetical protein